MMNMLAKAIQLASTAHLNQKDKSGKPYILHPLWVMDRVRHLGEDFMIVAVLHDVLEDTDVTMIDLANAGFNSYIVCALGLLDFRDVDYEKRIEVIGTGTEYPHKLAKEVKLRDIEHNSKITRLKGLRDKDFDRLKKYHKAYTFLLNN